jgi:hypothetical protein
MSLKNSYIKLSIFLLTCSINMWGQDAYAELDKVKLRYTSLKNYSIQLGIKAYKGHTSSEVADIITGKYEVSGTSFKLTLGSATTLRNENYLLGIDDKFHEIDVASVKKQEADQAGFVDFKKMEASIRKHNALSVKKGTDGNSVLTFDLAKSGDEYEKIIITYQPSGELVSVILFYRSPVEAYGMGGKYKARMEITYTSQNLNAVFPENHFSEKKYIRVTDREILPQPAYKNYKIFNLL